MNNYKMKKILLFSFVLGVASLETQINLVPNPSFEIYDTCVTELGQMDRATGWVSVRATPDYFNMCDTIIDIIESATIPSNYWGYQYPVSGNGYAGFTAKMDTT